MEALRRLFGEDGNRVPASFSRNRKRLGRRPHPEGADHERESARGCGNLVDLLEPFLNDYELPRGGGAQQPRHQKTTIPIDVERQIIASANILGAVEELPWLTRAESLRPVDRYTHDGQTLLSRRIDRWHRHQRARSSVENCGGTEGRRVSSAADCRSRSMAGMPNPRGPGPALRAGQWCTRHRGASSRRVHWVVALQVSHGGRVPDAIRVSKSVDREPLGCARSLRLFAPGATLPRGAGHRLPRRPPPDRLTAPETDDSARRGRSLRFGASVRSSSSTRPRHSMPTNGRPQVSAGPQWLTGPPCRLESPPHRPSTE